jgi:hypothetical protein
MEVRVVRQRGHAVHRLSVCGDDSLGFFRRFGGMTPREDFDCVFDARAISFDGRRSDGSLGGGKPAQCARPGLRRVAEMLRQVAAQSVKLGQTALQRG